MNKKILLGVAVLGGALLYYRNKKGTETAEPGTVQESIFTKYNNRVVADAKGIWMFIQNGKIYSMGQAALDKWFLDNPGLDVIQAPEDIWTFYAGTDMSVFGGTI